MSSPVAGSFDPLLCARRGEQLQACLPIAVLPRLVSQLAEPSGEVAYALEGGVDEQGVHYLRCRVQATVTLLCQRCLQPMSWPVDSESRLGLVPEGQAGQDLPEGYEPYEWPGGAVEIAALVEDELLLALPIAARHAVLECPAEPADQREETRSESPFAVLTKLKPTQT